MSLNKSLFEDVYKAHPKTILIATDLLTPQQLEKIFNIVLLKYNIKDIESYNNINIVLKEEIINYTYDLLDHYLLNPLIEDSYQLSFSDCCIIHGLYDFYYRNKKTFSPESLVSYIYKIYNIDYSNFKKEHIDFVRNTIKKFITVTPLSKKKKKQFDLNSSVIFPLFFCIEIKLTIDKEVITNYVITKKPNIELYRKEIDDFFNFLNGTHI